MDVHPLDALGNPVRREILLSLRDRPMAVHEIAQRFDVTRPAISRHLRVLREAGLVEARGSGASHVYQVRIHGLSQVSEFVDSFWDTALRRLHRLAADEEGQIK